MIKADWITSLSIDASWVRCDFTERTVYHGGLRATDAWDNKESSGRRVDRHGQMEGNLGYMSYILVDPLTPIHRPCPHQVMSY